MKTTNAQQICQNCDTAFVESFLFCPNCGQKNKNTHPTVKELIQEFFDNVFNFDSKIFQSLKVLAKPGQITLDYFNGKRQRYYTPLRFYLVSLLLMFATFNWLGVEGLVNIDLQSKEVYADYREEQVVEKLEKLLQEFRAETTAPEAIEILDNLDSNKWKLNNLHQGFPFPPLLGLEDEHGKRKQIPKEDLFNLTEKELADKYQIEGYFKRLYFIQFIKFFKDDKGFERYFYGNLIWTLLLMIPFYAWVSRMIYNKQHPHYIEHLVFALHFHTPAALLAVIATPMVLFSKWMLIPIVLFAISYSIFSMKRFYGGTFWQTVIKYQLIQTLFVPFSILIFIFSILTSFVLF